ncbi:MAG: hypothetical protein CMH44_03515 [Muricauda sp.]|nr:hypothetical protein [Allomuricauda sp.]
MDTKTISRKELYELVWSKPLTTLANEFSYSDNGIRKICIKHSIPLPKAGYWSKVKYNKKVAKMPLPKLKEEAIPIELSIREEDEDCGTHSNSIRAKVRKEIEQDSKLSFAVPDKLSNPHVLIRKTKMDLKDKRPREWGNGQGLLIPSQGVLNVSVSKKSLSRALKIMDRLIKLLEKRGHKIEVGNTTNVIIDGESVKIRLKEMVKRVPRNDSKWDRTELVPSGILSIRADSRWSSEHMWKESSDKPLEGQLSKILISLETRAMESKARSLEFEEQNRKWKEELRKEKEAEKQKADEQDNTIELFQIATRWKKAKDLREYIEAVKNHAIKSDSMTEEKREWIQWATNKANWMDPIVNLKDDILGSYSGKLKI